MYIAAFSPLRNSSLVLAEKELRRFCTLYLYALLAMGFFVDLLINTPTWSVRSISSMLHAGTFSFTY